MKRVIFAGLLLVILAVSVSGRSLYNIEDFGAVNDGETLNTAAIQAAIDCCIMRGGGTVLVPNGCFLTGTVVLKDNLDLHLAPTAVLKGSPHFNDYPAIDLNFGQTQHGALIYSLLQKNISISGKGMIDGNGGHANFQGKDKYNGLNNRPFAIAFIESSGVKLKEFTLKDGAFWNILLDKCNLVTVDDISVTSRIVANNDGIDISDCHDVRVSNCYFDNGDDAICLKSHSDVAVKRVMITNCIVKSESNGIKFGTRGDGGFEDVTISNCVIHDTRLSGITLQMVDGGMLNRVVINNITMHRVNGGIFFNLGKRRGDKPGIFRNVIISNVTADGIGCWKPDTSVFYFKDAHDQRIGMSMIGQPGYMMENIVLDNIYLQFADGGTMEDAQRGLTDRPEVYPEYTNFGVTPAYGINCQYVKDILFKNIKMEYLEKDERPAIYMNNMQDVRINSLSAEVSGMAKASVRIKNTHNIVVSDCKPLSSTPFLSLEGRSKNITLLNNDFSKLKHPYIKEQGIPGKEIKRFPPRISAWRKDLH